MRISDWSSDVCSSDLNDVGAGGVDVEALASALRPEVVQLWYQMALNGRRDLSLAPSPRSGFEMCLLRMLAFRPAEGGTVSASAPTAQRKTGPAAARAALEGGAPAKRKEAEARDRTSVVSGKRVVCRCSTMGERDLQKK